jgi:hypothetical protein
VTETDVRYAFERATEEISAPPDLLDRVRTGGRRRVVRRRSVLAAGLAAAAGAAALPLALRGRGDDRVLPATRGDLAGDRQLLRRIRAAWADAFTGPGEPHIWWAGSTPAGPVALVSQPTEIGQISAPGGVGQVPAEMLGFVATAGGRLRVPNEFVPVPAGTIQPIALLTGARRDVLVVAGGGRPIQFSEDFAFDGAGRITRRFVPLPAGPDGVLVRTVPAAGDAIRFGLREDDTSDPDVPLIDLANRWDAAMVGSQPTARMERRLPGSILAWTDVPADELRRWDVMALPGYYSDQFGYHPSVGTTAFWIRGQAPDGRLLVVQTVVLDDRVRLFVLLGKAGDKPTPRYLGLLGPQAFTEVRDEIGGPLPILHVRLPERQGVVAAAENATFRYRVRGAASWLPTDGDAVLLPEAATELEVRPQRGRAVTLRLP